MVNERCPNCRTIRELRVASSKRMEKDNDGQPVQVMTNSYYCGTCHTFIKSVDMMFSSNGEVK